MVFLIFCGPTMRNGTRKGLYRLANSFLSIDHCPIGDHEWMYKANFLNGAIKWNISLTEL